MSTPPKHRPDWWPPSETWPPHGWRGRPRGAGGGRFFLRAAVLGFVMLTLVVGLCTLAFWSAVYFGDWRNERPPAQAPTDPRPPFVMMGQRPVGPVIVFWLGAAALVTFVIARNFRRLVAPVSDIMQAATQVERGDYSVRVRERGNRDTRALARAFNAMTAKLEFNGEQRKRLLADVTHELRTPLTVIQGKLEGVLDGVYPRDETHLRPILEETQLMSRLIDDLRMLSLAEAGALRLQREPTDLAAMLEDAAMAFAGEAARKRVSVVTDVAGALPQLEIDAVRIREVLSNLIVNALRHTPAGGVIRIEARLDSDWVAVTVSDTGNGIAPEDLPHVFERFYKSADSGGSGLGLAIAKGLIEAHGGIITAESVVESAAPGVVSGTVPGTRIRFTLPVR